MQNCCSQQLVPHINHADIKIFLKADAWPVEAVVSRWHFSNGVFNINDTTATDKPLDMSCATQATKPDADSATAAINEPAQDGTHCGNWSTQ